MITRCSNCAKEISESDETCPFCGKDFTAPVKPARPLAPQEEKRRPAPRAMPPEPTQWEEVTPDGVVIPPSPPQEPRPIAKNLVVAAGLLLAAVGLWRQSGSAPKAPGPVPFAAQAASAPALARVAPAQGSPGLAASPLSQTPAPPDPVRSSGLPRARSNAQRRGEAGAPEEPIILDSAPPSMREWRFSGRVFDLLTLQPVADAELVFANPEGGERFPIVTDSNGLYRLVLPAASGGYDMSVSHPKYEPKYLPDGNPPLAGLPLARRREIGIDSAITLQHKEMFLPDPGGELRRDLALIPLAAPKEP